MSSLLCHACKLQKPTTEFARMTKRARGYQYSCRACNQVEASRRGSAAKTARRIKRAALIADGWQVEDHPQSLVPYRVKADDPDTMEVRAHSGETFMISASKWDLVRSATFWISRNIDHTGVLTGHLYVRARMGPKDFTLSRVLMGVANDPTVQVDHIGGHLTTLDNRDSNLRVVTSTENNRNRRLHRNNKTGVNGVFRPKKRKAWVAYVINNGQGRLVYFPCHPGSGCTEEQAHQQAIACRQANDIVNNNTNGQRPKYVAEDEPEVAELLQP